MPLRFEYSRPVAQNVLTRLHATSGTLSLITCDKDVTVAFGDAALRKLIGETNFTVDAIHSYILPRHDGSFIIPTYDPNDLFASPDYGHWIEHALKKARLFAQGRLVIDLPVNVIRPTDVPSLFDALARASQEPVVAIDIECIPDLCELTSIAIAFSDTYSIVIPFVSRGLEPYWSEEQEVLVWNMLAQFLASDQKKLFHNFIFDTQVLRKNGLEVRGEIDDTMLRANALNPLLNKGLKDLVRIYCLCEPWKDKKDFLLTGDPESFWLYNATDAAKTYKVYLHQEHELKARNVKAHYDSFIKPLIPLVTHLCTTGISVNVNKLKEFDQTLELALNPINEELQRIIGPLFEKVAKKNKVRNKEKDKYGPSPKTGKQIVIEKGYDETIEPFNPRSPEQVKTALTLLGYRIPIKRGKPTTDRESLLKIYHKKPHPFIKSLLEYARLAKLRSSYTSITLDQDDQCRFSINIAGTISGRFSAAKTAWNTGLNVQTVPRGTEAGVNVKSLFVPRRGMQFLEVDLSQAELRIVAWLSNETKLMELFAKNEDVHDYTAKRIEEISGIHCPRQLGKRINHASNYGMGPAKFAVSCLVEAGIDISVDTAGSLLAARAKTFPQIGVWHRELQATLHRSRILVSPYGRAISFYGPITDDTLRQALSFIPQATVVDALNSAWQRIEAVRCADPNTEPFFRTVIQVHDSLLFEVEESRVLDLARIISAELDGQYIPIRGVNHVIPHDFKVGPSWGEMKKLEASC